MISKNFLFGLPIYITQVDPKKYDKDKIVNTISKNYSIDSHRNIYDDHLSDIHHSYRDTKNKKFKNVDFKETKLLSVYKEIFNKFVYETLKTKNKFLYGYIIENYTATKNAQFLREHWHPGADFSVIHYLQFDSKNHSNTLFKNSNDFGPYVSYLRKNFYKVCDDKNLDNSYLFNEWKFQLQEDDMIIFPSFLKHEIPKQKNNIDKLRITIASNIMIEKKEEDFLQ